MSMYPKSEHFRFLAILGSLVGIFPSLIFPIENAKESFFFKSYRKFIYLVFGTASLSSYSKLFVLLTAENQDFAELMQNLSVSLLIIMTGIRQIVIHNKHQIPRMFNYISKINEKYAITDDADEGEKILASIHKESSKNFNRIVKTYSGLIFVVMLVHMLRPVFIFKEVTHYDGNSTVLEKTFPISIWVPYNEQRFFFITNLLIGLWVVSMGLFQTFTDSLLYCLIMFAGSELRALNYILRNFDSYKEKLMEKTMLRDRIIIQENSTDYGVLLLKKCIHMHWDIIKYVEMFNEAMATLMVIDFIQASLNVTCIFSQVIMMDITPFTITFEIIFVLMGTYRLYIFYFYGNEIILLSLGLSDSAWQSNWYKESRQFKFMIKMFMTRCKKPLKFNIGPFSTIGLEALISILRASYSYLMFFVRSMD